MLCLATTIYHIWREKNQRFHDNSYSDVESVSYSILGMIKLRLSSYTKVKDTGTNRKHQMEWRLLESIFAWILEVVIIYIPCPVLHVSLSVVLFAGKGLWPCGIGSLYCSYFFSINTLTLLSKKKCLPANSHGPLSRLKRDLVLMRTWILRNRGVVPGPQVAPPWPIFCGLCCSVQKRQPHAYEVAH